MSKKIYQIWYENVVRRKVYKMGIEVVMSVRIFRCNSVSVCCRTRCIWRCSCWTSSSASRATSRRPNSSWSAPLACKTRTFDNCYLTRWRDSSFPSTLFRPTSFSLLSRNIASRHIVLPKISLKSFIFKNLPFPGKQTRCARNVGE